MKQLLSISLGTSQAAAVEHVHHMAAGLLRHMQSALMLGQEIQLWHMGVSALAAAVATLAHRLCLCAEPEVPLQGL